MLLLRTNSIFLITTNQLIPCRKIISKYRKHYTKLVNIVSDYYVEFNNAEASGMYRSGIYMFEQITYPNMRDVLTGL
jgi:hypothetical protein